ncbi:MAG: ATP-binding protein [Myxococcota bacterium]|nr:ATP-binding protein [Myxococcota bacterium]
MNESRYLSRWLEATVEEMLAEFPVVIVTGARQTGKTTMVRHLPSARTRHYVSLDDLRVLDRAQREPDALMGEAPRMTVDEVQRAPDLLRAIKRAVDRDRRPGRFLLTSSANLLLMRTVSESLAGRAVYLRLGPLTEAEKAGRSAPVWSALLGASGTVQARDIIESAGRSGESWMTAACSGGLPPVLGLTSAGRGRWFDGYVATYLERDLQHLAGISALADFRRLTEIAALRLGGLLNRADLARDAALTRPTTHRYIGILETSWQVRLLRPYVRGRTQRLVKSPKLYWTDTGLAAHLAGLGDPRELAASPRRGAYLENLLLCQVDAWRETVSPRPEAYFRRTASGAEVDLVLVLGRRVLPIEVKASVQARASDADAVERFLDGNREASCGLVAYAGDEVVPLSARVLAVPVGRLL